jgi:hypothetical protein
MYYVLCTTYYVLHRGAIYVHCIVTSVTGIAITVTVVTVTSSSPCHLHSLSSPLAFPPACSQCSSRHRSFLSKEFQTTCLPSPGHRRGDPQRESVLCIHTIYIIHPLSLSSLLLLSLSLLSLPLSSLYCAFTLYTSHIHCHYRHCRYCHCRHCHYCYRHCRSEPPPSLSLIHHH